MEDAASSLASSQEEQKSFGSGPFPTHYYLLLKGILHDHRAAEVGRHLWRSPSLNPCSARSATAGCPGLCPRNCVQGWRLHRLSRQPVPVFDHP